MERKTTKERLIERLNNGFDLDIKPDHTLKTHCNPQGFFDAWSWCFVGAVRGKNFGGVIGSYAPISQLLKAKTLVLGCSEIDGEWSVTTKEEYDSLTHKKLFTNPIFEHGND